MSKKNYDEMSMRIIELIGGKENVSFFTHCVTRLRFNVRDKSLVRINELNGIQGVIGSQWSGEQLQVIIGQDVKNVYRNICSISGLEAQEMIHENLDSQHKKFKINMIFEFISGTIAPLFPILIGCGLIQAIVSLSTQFGLMSTESGTYAVLNFVGNAGYYFLPVFVGYTAAKKLNANPILGMLMGSILIHPNFISAVSSGTLLNVFGLPIYAANYTSTIIPVILVVFVMSIVEKYVDKIMPSAFKASIEPLVIILIMTPLALCLFAPAGTYVANLLNDGFLWIYNNLGFVGLALIGAAFPLLVILGLHTATGTIIFTMFSQLGYDPIFLPVNVISNFNQGIASLAIGFKSKNSDIKSKAISCGTMTMLGGVTEPTLFGINLKYKTGLIASIVGNFAGLLVAGITNVKCFNFSVVGITAFASFVGSEPNNLMFGTIAVITGWIVTFVLSYIMYKD